MNDQALRKSGLAAPVLSALKTLSIEGKGLEALSNALANGLGDPFIEAIETIRGISGRVIVTGVGKSGHIGSKIAATLASTGTPAFFVHPAEANHGDLGMIARDDVIVAITVQVTAVEGARRTAGGRHEMTCKLPCAWSGGSPKLPAIG